MIRSLLKVIIIINQKHKILIFLINIGNVIKDSIDINKSITNVDNNIELILSYIAADELNGDCYDIIIINTNPKQNCTFKIYLISSHYVIFLMMAEKQMVEGFETLRRFIKELARLPVFIVITGFKKILSTSKINGNNKY